MTLGPRLWTGPAPSLLSGPTHLYDQGIVLTTRFGKVGAAYRWEQITNLWYDIAMRIVHDKRLGSIITERTQKLTFGLEGGRQVLVRLREAAVRTLARDFASYGLHPHTTPAAEEVAKHVRAAVADAQLPSVRRELADGGVIDFGALSVTADEIRHQGEALPWREVSSLGFIHRYSSRPPADRGGFARIAYDIDRRWWDVPAADVPNLGTLEKLYDSIPRQPKRLPVTGDYEPPGGKHSVGTLYFRCAGCGTIGGGRRVPYRLDASGDYDWPLEYECHCGHSGELTRQEVLPRDSEWTCTVRGCDTSFAVPAGAALVTCPVCRTGHRR